MCITLQHSTLFLIHTLAHTHPQLATFTGIDSRGINSCGPELERFSEAYLHWTCLYKELSPQRHMSVQPLAGVQLLAGVTLPEAGSPYKRRVPKGRTFPPHTAAPSLSESN